MICLTNVFNKFAAGPRFPDGSINWQCPCMANGSLVAHRCGHYFRKLYICMSEDEKVDATIKCPEEFIVWAACMQNLSGSFRTGAEGTNESPFSCTRG
ncbi:unnamed protein product [Nippostrongylus brasiliensis]|uniref:CHCH domain-containing protein n=1 Tax=Nippostrongylus brasiliensis TaxID=27835 RepID=A0A0N4YHG8_NIPBR|nr:unnamed protein product [Nippostrongylus brasiliensis]